MSGAREALMELDTLLDFATPWSCDCIADKSAVHAAFEKARAALATPDWLPIPREVDTTRAPFDKNEWQFGWAGEPRVVTQGRWVRDEFAKKPKPYFDTSYGRIFGVHWMRANPPTHYRLLPAPPTENDDAQ